MDGSKFSQAMQGIGGAAGVLGSWAGAYMGVPKAESNKRYMKKANMVGNWRYGASDMAGLMSQWRNTPTLQNISGKDLYDPSSEELFSNFAGAGASSYAAMSGLTAPLKGKLGSTQIGGKSANAPGTTPSHVDTELMQNAETREEQFDIAEGAFQDMGLGETGKTLSVAAANQGQSAASPDYSDLFPTGAPYAQPNQFMVGQGFDCGGHMHGCGGHKFAMGGMSFDNGSAISMALNLASAGIGIGLSYAGTMAQKRKAEMEAKEVNAANLYAQQLQKHNFDEAVNDTKNNMFRQQALQMMAMGGDLQTQGADFPLFGDFNIIGAGGTHEQNPFGGVFQGVAQDGQANLVEEDEVVWNDYVFSNRIKIPKSFADDYKLSEGITYAEAAKKLSKEAEERPNDPISQNGLSAVLGALMQSQEEVKAKREEARMKRAIAKMSPEEIMNMLGALGGGQQFAEGGVLDGYSHIFAKGGSKGADGGKGKGKAARKAADAAAARDRGLYESALNHMSPEMIEYLARNIEGYNASDYTTTDAPAKRKQFLLDNYDKLKFEGLQGRVAAAQALPRLETRPGYTYTETEGYSMTPEQWNTFFGSLNAYKESRKAGNTSGKYHADSNFDNSGKTAAQVEQDPRYQAFKKYVREQAVKYANGEQADENALRYLQTLDEGINTSKGAQRLLEYNPDGSVKMVDGRMQLRQGWEADYDKRNYDQIGGIYHFYTDTPDVTKTKTGERTIVRLRGRDGNFQDVAMTPEEIATNPYIRKAAQNGADKVTTDDDGNQVTTHYLDYELPELEAEYTPEEEPERPPMLQTWPRYMPVLGSAIGALASMKPAKDYSTGFTPRTAHYAPIGDYLPYLPVDTQRYINAENQQAAAQLNAIMNASAGNRNMAMAQAALANQQRQQGIGQRMQAAEQINWDRLRQAGEFNRGTNMFNAQAHNQAELANLQNNPLLLRQEQQNAMMRHAVDNERDAAISQNLTALFDNLGNIGRENLAWNQANSNEALRYFSDPNWLMAGVSGYKKPTNAGVTETVTVGAPSASALGGYLLSKPTKKNRR